MASPQSSVGADVGVDSVGWAVGCELGSVVLGAAVGRDVVGLPDGADTVGRPVGANVVGIAVGWKLGTGVGSSVVGATVGTEVGCPVGARVVGIAVGTAVGAVVGVRGAAVGARVGVGLGKAVGRPVGIAVGATLGAVHPVRAGSNAVATSARSVKNVTAEKQVPAPPSAWPTVPSQRHRQFGLAPAHWLQPMPGVWRHWSSASRIAWYVSHASTSPKHLKTTTPRSRRRTTYDVDTRGQSVS